MNLNQVFGPQEVLVTQLFQAYLLNIRKGEGLKRIAGAFVELTLELNPVKTQGV